MAKLLLGI